MEITKGENGQAVIKLYSSIGDWEASAENFTRVFEKADADNKEILIRLHCMGGSCFDGIAIYNTIRNSKAYVTVQIDGVSASMSSIIMLAAQKIIAADNALVMLHPPSTYAQGTSKELRKDAELLDKLQKNAIKRYSEKSGRPEAEIEATYFDGSDHWLDADEALAAGLIDEIIPAVVPNIKQLDKPANEKEMKAVYSKYTAMLSPNLTPPTPNYTAMKKLLITTFALSGLTEDSSDQAIADALQAKMKAEPPVAGATPPPHQASVAKETAEAVLDSVEHMTGKAYEPSARATLAEIGEKAGLPAMRLAMGAVAGAAANPAAHTPAPKIVDMLGNNTKLAATDRAGWSFDEWQTKDAKGLAALEYDAFNAIYKDKFGVNAPK